MLSCRTYLATKRRPKLKETGEFKTFATRFGPGFPSPRREQLETRRNKRDPPHHSLGRKTYSANGNRIWTKRRCLAKRHFLRQKLIRQLQLLRHRLLRQVHHLRQNNSEALVTRFVKTGWEICACSGKVARTGAYPGNRRSLRRD